MRRLIVTGFVLFIGFVSWIHAQEASVVCDAAKADKDWVVAGKEGWLFSRTDLLPPVDIATSLPYLQRLNEALAKQGVTLVMVITPKRPMVADTYLELSEENQAGYDVAAARTAYGKTIADVRSVGIVAPDMLEVALAMSSDDPYFFRGDLHWRPLGAKATAQAIAQAVTELELELPQSTFVSNEEGTDELNGVFATKVEETCGITLTDETMPVFITESTAEQSLLGDTPAPEVVLVGTSFSKSAREPGYNFEGFLKETLSTNVLNMGVTAGGAFGAFQSYLLSEDFQNHKPKLLLWELQVPTSRIFNNLADYRQLIPSVQGACTTETSLVSNTVMLEGQAGTLLTNTDGNIQGQSYFLALQIADPTLVKFALTLKHSNGEEDVVEIERSTRAGNTGEFMVELSEIAAPLSEVVLGAEQAVSTSVEARVCQQ